MIKEDKIILNENNLIIDKLKSITTTSTKRFLKENTLHINKNNTSRDSLDSLSDFFIKNENEGKNIDQEFRDIKSNQIIKEHFNFQINGIENSLNSNNINNNKIIYEINNNNNNNDNLNSNKILNFENIKKIQFSNLINETTNSIEIKNEISKDNLKNSFLENDDKKNSRNNLDIGIDKDIYIEDLQISNLNNFS
jgi:hypothetical protein